MTLKAPRPAAERIKGNLKSKTVWFNLATAAAGVTAVLAANPALIAAYGPHAIVAVTVINVLLRNVTTKPVQEK